MNNFDLCESNLDFLYETVLKLKDKEECRRYFCDLCTIPELKAISQRVVVARMLSNNCNYQDIVEKTGASTATISRVNRSLHYGEGGYKKVFERLDEDGDTE